MIYLKNNAGLLCLADTTDTSGDKILLKNQSGELT